MYVTELQTCGLRCFAEGQSVRITPLTLLVGENGTGKTTVLGLIRELWDGDPAHVVQDTDGEGTPALLADLARGDASEWLSLKSGLDRFGRRARLFDDIEVHPPGTNGGGRFQIRVRRHGVGSRSKGPWRNIAEAGCGVSEVLPVVTEMLRPASPARPPRLSLLQQPEVHLHPRAQAALGSLFCDATARRDRQIIVETHSDHLIDRVRMDIRDGETDLKLDDASILYCERSSLGVTIHSLGWDAHGNLVAHGGDIPDGYREFFRTERHRSLGLS